MKPWVAYSLVRLGIFAAVFTIVMLVGTSTFRGSTWVIAALIGAIVSLCVAYIFFRPLRDAVARDLQNARAKPAPDADGTVEDEL